MSAEQSDVMDCLEAKAVLDRIKEDPVGRFEEVRDFKCRRGWAALCYTSWEACRIGELLPKETGKKDVKPKVETVEAPSAVKPKKHRWTMDDWFDLAKELSDRNGGLVPHNMELRRIKKYPLYRRMKAYPSQFAERGLFLDHKGGRASNLKVATKKSVRSDATTRASQGQS